MNEITLTLTPAEFATVWACMMKQPAENVFLLLNKVQGQVNAQELAHKLASAPPSA